MPSDRWAASGAKISPGFVKVSNGWGAEVPPPEWFNWWMNRADSILDRFDSLPKAIANTEEGQNFILNSWDSDRVVGESIETQTLAGAEVCTWVDCDGETVLVARTSRVELYEPADLSTVVRTFTPTNAGTIVKCLTNGVHVVAIYGQYVEVWERDTGTSIGQVDFGATVNDCCFDGASHVVVCGARDATTPKTACTIELATATEGSAYDHGAECYSICTLGAGNVVLIGANGGTGSDKQAVRLSGGMTPLAELDPSITIGAGEPRVMATDGDVFAVHNGDTGVYFVSFDQLVNEIEKKNPSHADQGSKFTSAAGGPGFVAFAAAGAVHVVRPGKGFACLGWASFGGSATAYVGTDGADIWVAVDAGATQQLRRLAGPSRPTVWRRTEPADGNPFHLLAIPN